MVIKGDGNVGIGTASPTFTLDVAGGIRCAANGSTTSTEGANNAIIAYAPSGITGLASIWMGYDPTNDCGYINSARNGAIRPVCLQTRGGPVGIGITNPSYPLQVNGYSANGATVKYINYGNVPNWTGPTAGINTSIYASSCIGSGDAFYLTSDERIKIEETPVSDYLSVIEKIEPKAFSYVDKVHYGTQTRVGFFAQEVEKVLPDAVSKTKDFIPNIFTKCPAEGNCVTVVNHGMTEGTKVRVFSGEDKLESNIHVIDENTIQVEKILEKEVFVFGTEVDDFRVLNYDYMSSVAFGGLKELSALVKTQAQTIETLEARLRLLESKRPA
jgi:hypothetical protein